MIVKGNQNLVVGLIDEGNYKYEMHPREELQGTL